MPVATADNWNNDYDVGQGYLPSMDLSSENKILNFTHMCAGYMEPTSTGSYDKTGTRLGTAMAVILYEDSIQYTTYHAAGVYTGNYSLDVTVPRDHAVAEEPDVPDPTPDDIEIPEGYTLARIEVVNQGNTKYFVNETLDTDGLSVVAVYTKENATDVRKSLALQTEENEDGYTVSGVDMGKAGKQYVTVTYGQCVGSFAIEVYETHFENETGTVAVDFSNYGITSVAITEAPKEVLGYSAYVTYDITPVGYTQGDEATVTIALDMDLFNETRPVRVLDQGNVIATPAIVEGKITFTTNHFSQYDVAQVDADALDWIAIPGENKTIFRLTNSLTANKKYVIVSTNVAGDATATNLNGSNINTTTVTVIADADGNYIEAPATTAQWTYTSNRFRNVSSTNRYLRGNSGTLSSTTSTNNTTTYITWSLNDSGLRARQYSNYGNNYRYMTSVTATETNSNSRVYIYEEDTLANPGGFVALGGERNQSYATSANASLDTVLGKLLVYTSADGAVIDEETIAVTSSMVTWDKEFDGSTAGTYTGTVKYNNVTLGDVTVTVTAKTAQDVTLDKYEGTVERDSGTDAETGAYLSVLWEGETEPERIPVTVGMLNGNVNVNKNGTYPGLSFSYAGQTFENFTLTVKNKTGPAVNDYPAYPNPGSVDLKKTATGVDFQNTGIARVELSTSGLPYAKGVDVIVMLDMSSSMDRCITCGNYTSNWTDRQDGCSCSSSVSRVDELVKAMNSLQTQLQKSTNSESIKIAVADFNGVYTSGPSDYSDSGCSNTTEDVGALTNGGTGKVYTGSHRLEAAAFIPATELDVSTFADASSTYKYAPSTGTNYDYAFDAIYQLGHAIKTYNAQNNLDGRELFVIFMSDGAANQFNYYNTTGGRSGTPGTADWDAWLTGNVGEGKDYTFAEIIDCQTHAYYFDAATGNQHRMANAIKGDPSNNYEIIRKNQGAGENGVDAVTSALIPLTEGEVNYGKDNIYKLPGLGATTYTAAFYVTNDGNISADSAKHSLKATATSDAHYIDAAEPGALADAFHAIGSDIAYAATNARYVDQMGDSFNLQMNPAIGTNAEGSSGTVTTNTDITITTRPVYTKDDVNNTTVTEDDIGKPYGNGTTVETVKFAVDNSGNITATTTAGGYTLPDGTTVTANSTNILVGGVLYGKNFFYNNNNAAVTVTLANGSAFSLPGETFYWNIGTINESQYTIAYTVYLDGAMEGTPPSDSYATNNFAILYYTNHEGNEVSKSVASPTIAWKGANVSYAFYLVNDEGKPVYADGTVAPNFLLSHKVTQPVVYQSVLLNDDNGATLEAQALAVLPAGYELFSPNAVYNVQVGSGDGEGANISKWTITGDEKQTTYVVGYGDTDDYSKEQNVSNTSYDYTHTTVYFAVKWIIGAVQDTVVVDYGLPVDINVMSNDMFGSAGTLHAVGKRADKPDGYGSSLAEEFSTTSVAGEFGTAVLKDGKIRYTLNDMQMNNAEKLAYAVDYDGEANPGYYYGDLTIIPATTVYYEDQYVTLKTFTRPDADTAYTEKSGWPVNSVAASGTQAEDRPGSFSLGIIDANNIYGYDQAYDQMSTHSMGNSAMIHVDANQYGTAEFSFWGTGFDVISTTSNKTGTLVVQVYDKDGKLVTLNGKPLSDAVDTYYGYVYGLYNVVYQKVNGLWTLVSVGDPAPAGTTEQTKSEITSGSPSQDGTVTGYQYTWKPVNNDPNALYQVPVIQYSGLPYAKYTVKISALYYPTFDATAEAGYDLYLDAIRVYDPAGNGDQVVSSNGDKNTTIADIYAQDGEAWPSYHELRNLIINAKTFDSLGADDEVPGIVFIDGDETLGEGPTVTGNVIIDYTNFGPNNELYLASGQAVAFNMNLGSANDHPGYVPVVRIGMKTVGGKNAVAELWNATVNNGEVSRFNAISDALQTATDMYYDITVLNGRTVVIKNSGEGGSVLSITNIKLTYKPTITSTAGINEPATVGETEQPAPLMFSISRSAANAALMSLAPVQEETPEVTVPEETLPEETVPEETKPAEPDNSELKSAVNAAKKLKEKDYTKESYKEVKSALKSAEKVLKDKKATQAEIDNALSALNAAVEALKTNASAAKPQKPAKDEKPDKGEKPSKDEEPGKAENQNKPAAKQENAKKEQNLVLQILDALFGLLYG